MQFRRVQQYMFVICVVFGTEGPLMTHSHENGLMNLQDQRSLGSIPLPGNEVVKHPYDPSDPNKFKFEIVRKLKSVQLLKGFVRSITTLLFVTMRDLMQLGQ